MTDGKTARIVVVGAGHGGGNMVSFLRQFGHEGPITLIGAETVPPYHRPPLSKAYLKGEATAESLKLRADSFYEEKGITLRLGTTVVAIDTAARRVRLADGSEEAYDKLVLATGSTPRRLTIAGSELDGVLELRHLDDAAALKAAIGPGRRLAVIGGGYIGLEAAASAIALGASTTIIEREARLLARVACEQLATFFQGYHEAKGVEIITSAHVERLEGTDGRVSAVVLADGRSIPCDAVLVGIGGVPTDELARAARLLCENGIVVDGEARTSDPHIYAIGDVAWRPMPLYGGRMFRLESVPNAIEQARRVSHDIIGLPQPADEVPWFWSDQFDLKLQIAGVPFDAEELIIRGARDEGRFAIFHLRDQRVLAVEAVNSAKDFLFGRSVIGTGKRVDRVRLADPEVPVKETLVD
jgi:3-phenylpropionate/trans-cinnamate dioxygenase ferredoxin reductase subunit